MSMGYCGTGEDTPGVDPPCPGCKGPGRQKRVYSGRVVREDGQVLVTNEHWQDVYVTPDRVREWGHYTAVPADEWYFCPFCGYVYGHTYYIDGVRHYEDTKRNPELRYEVKNMKYICYECKKEFDGPIDSFDIHICPSCYKED